MTASSKFLFGFALVFGLLGVGLLYEGIGRMKRAGVPPFNDGLYEATWTVSRPPSEVIHWCDGLVGRVVIWGCALCLPALCALLALRHDRIIVPALLMGLWSIAAGFLGIWTWLFSLFA